MPDGKIDYQTGIETDIINPIDHVPEVLNLE
jgi:hypothetical protein